MAIDTVTNESILDQYGGVRINSLDHAQIAQNDRPDVGPISANVGHDIGLMSEIISGRYRLISGRLHVCTWARCRPDVVNDIRPTSGRYRLDVGPISENHRGSMSARYRQMSATTSAWCRKLYRADIGKCRLISGRLHVCTWARCRPDVVNDIRPTSGRCLKTTEVWCRKRYRADIRPISERLDIGNDIRPTSGPCRKTREARCWKRYRADIILYVLQHNIGWRHRSSQVWAAIECNPACIITPQSHIHHIVMKYTLTRKNTVQQFIERKKHDKTSSHWFSPFEGRDEVMNCSVAPTPTTITDCSKPLRHHQFYVVVARNFDVISPHSFWKRKQKTL